MKAARGFTLVEVAIALMIIGLLLGGAVVTVSAQIDLKQYAETRQTMELAQEAILGFAAANGRLPCPATMNPPPNEEGEEIPKGGNCAENFRGFVPAKTLALRPVNANGLLVDAWGQPIRYAVTDAHTNGFTTANGLRDLFGTEDLQQSPKLSVCSAMPCTGQAQLTPGAAFVLITSGPNLAIDNGENSNDNDTFIFEQSSTAVDDLMVWTSPFTLYNRMLAAGAL
jgi:prepilin-type N-terminal cleavage/methylation domain-containing protein